MLHNNQHWNQNKLRQNENLNCKTPFSGHRDNFWKKSRQRLLPDFQDSCPAASRCQDVAENCRDAHGYAVFRYAISNSPNVYLQKNTKCLNREYLSPVYTQNRILPIANKVFSYQNKRHKNKTN